MASRMFDNITALFGGASQTSAADYANGYSIDETAVPRGGYGAQHQMRSIAAPVGNAQHQSMEQEYDDDDATEREDLLDQHVAYYLKHHPQVHEKHSLVRIRPGVYNFDGREISVEWQYSEQPDEPGYLIAIDGPLRQPFSDYMAENENGIEYDVKRLGKSSLSQIPKGKRLSFGDGNKVYSRLEAMKVAKEQALVREKAAEYAKDGMMVPQAELMQKYKKTISQKLGERRQRPTRPEPEAEAPQAVGCPAPAEAPVAVPTPPPAASPAPAPASSGKGSKQTHGAPRYCEKHSSSNKRKKCKPQNLPCTQCGQVIQTNYVEFTLCPTCSERDHRCMCCGAAAVGSAPSPQAAPSSPMNARSSPKHNSPSKSPTADASPMSPMNLFGMPDLFGMKAKPATEPQNAAGGAYGGGAAAFSSGFVQNRPGTVMTPQNNVYASQTPMASQNPYASQNAYAAPYNAMASQNIMVGRR